MIKFQAGRYDHPIYSKEGGWPKKLEQVMIENGKREGYPYPRLPPLSVEEIEFIKGYSLITIILLNILAITLVLLLLMNSEIIKPIF